MNNSRDYPCSETFMEDYTYKPIKNYYKVDKYDYEILKIAKMLIQIDKIVREKFQKYFKDGEL